MRILSNSVRDELSKSFGVDTQLIIGVKWSDDREVYYSSHERVGAVKAVLSVDGLETTRRIEGSGASQSVTVVLSDTGGELTSILNSIDVHKRPAKVYLSFDGVPLDLSVTLIDGEINSEMVWDETARTFTFSILSKIEGRQFGFAVEDGLFHEVDERQRTTPWPFRFGTTCAYPAVEIQNGVQGIMRIGQGVVDPTLDAQICQAQQIDCPKIPGPVDDTPVGGVPTDPFAQALQNFSQDLQGDPFAFQPGDTFGPNAITPENPNGQSATAGTSTTGRTLIPDKRCERDKFNKLCQLLRDRANQLVYVNPTLLILNGEKFPQGIEVTIRIDDVLYTGTFSGEVFTIDGETREDAPDNPDCSAVNTAALGYRQSTEAEPGSLEACNTPTQTFQLQVVGGAGEAFRLLDRFESTGFKWLPSGSTVTLENVSKQVHVVSAVPGVVTSVTAYRTFADVKVLTEVPADRYTVVTTNYGGLSVVEVHTTRPMSTYLNERWEDQLYVNFTSSIGPNPRDVIEWIVDRYTDFTVDTASFDAVDTLLTNYPCNFAYSEKRNVFDVLNQIAYEARCALTVTDNVVKLTYLPKEPDSVRTLTSSDLVARSFKFKHSRTEDLITSSRVTWKPWGAESLDLEIPERSFTVENNVNKYGFFDANESYQTINNFAQALKTATFWSIRDSNTWRLVEFQTTIQQLDLELFDCVTLDLPVFPNTKVIINSMTVSPSENVITFEAWTPILSGTASEYFFAWPATKPSGVPYPNNNFDIVPPVIQVTPPSAHPLYVENPNQPVPPTTGDRFPSDVGDTFPTTVCQDAADSLLIDTIQPQFDRIDFQDLEDAAIRADQANEQFGGGGGGPLEDKENVVCGRNSFEADVWVVRIVYATATSIAQVDAGCSILPGPCKTSGTGKRCGGPLFWWCHTMGSEIMARAFVDSIRAQIRAQSCKWTVGKTGPAGVLGPTLASGNGDEVGNVELGNGAYNV